MGNEKVLIIEDNELNMKLVRSLLQLGKYRVFEADNAEKGLQLMRANRPDLVLMDIQLPGMNGLKATQIIKKDNDLKHTPVVALTSYAMQGDEKKAVSAGCAGYITKPIDTRSFLDQIQKFIKHDAQETKAPNSDRPASQNSTCAKVLIVDDEPKNIKLLSAQMPPSEFNIISAHGGIEAMQKINDQHPDLILLDIMMPDMDGYEVTRRVKANPATKEIPIILITALDSKDDKVKGLEAGAEEFLTKPVNMAELRTRINSMLRLRQYRDQLKQRIQSEQNFTSSQKPRVAEQEPQDRPCVLLVEDNEKDINIIRCFMQAQPYELIVCRDGEEAIMMARKGAIDLILLDIMLPGMDGFDVCRNLKESDETKHIQVVVITFLTDLESKIKGVEMGADDYLIKPIDKRELAARIKVLLQKKAYLDRLHSHYEMALTSAIKDAPTGLYNHVYFKQFLELEVKRAIRQEYTTALIMIDIDDFKRFNDTYGHLTGDRVLNAIARVIKDNVRETDLPARYGGEEFAIVLPYSDSTGAETVAARIKRDVQLIDFPCEPADKPSKITVSIGVAQCPLNADTADKLIQRADEMLYQAKNEGKDRIRVCAGEVSN